jgi:hypothetical protein
VYIHSCISIQAAKSKMPGPPRLERPSPERTASAMKKAPDTDTESSSSLSGAETNANSAKDLGRKGKRPSVQINTKHEEVLFHPPQDSIDIPPEESSELSDDTPSSDDVDAGRGYNLQNNYEQNYQ